LREAAPPLTSASDTFKSRAACCAVETGLFTSLVLSTLPKPTASLSRPATVCSSFHSSAPILGSCGSLATVAWVITTAIIEPLLYYRFGHELPVLEAGFVLPL